MDNPLPSPEFEEKIRQSLNPPEAGTSFINGLRARLIAKAAQQKPQPRHFFPRPAWQWVLAALVIILIAFLAIGPLRVVAAMQRLFGYVPGVGVVDQSAPLRAIAAPVTVERGGITLTVKQAVASADKTVVVYRVENIPAAMLAGDWREGETPTPRCLPSDSLHLSNGATFNVTGGGGGVWYTGYEYRAVFNPLPADVNDATLLVSCLLDTIPGAAPEKWEVPLHFSIAPPEMTIVPVLEVTPTPIPTGETGSDVSLAPPSPLTIERSIELEDGYILIGKFYSITLPNGLVTSQWPWSMLKFTDANGQEIFADYATDVDLPEVTANTSSWAYRIRGKYFAWPLTITLESVEAAAPGDVTFAFDTGTQPQPGAQWDLNQDFSIGGYNVRLLSIYRNPDGYAFTFKTDPIVQSVGVTLKGMDEYIAPAGGGGGGGMGDFSASLVYAGKVPSGKLTIVFDNLMVNAPGPWSVQWTPAVLPPGDMTPTPAPQACLTDEVWAQVHANIPASVPTGLSGKFAFIGLKEGTTNTFGVVTVNLDGSERQFHADGFAPAFSPDGTKLAYTAIDGVYVLDLATDAAMLLPGTTSSDYRLAWSPDGSQMAFVRSEVNEVFVIHLDGSGLTQVTNSPQYEILAGWTPDGRQVVLAAAGADGVQVRLHDLESGPEQAMFPISSNKADVVVSRDGQWIAFTDRVTAMSNGLFVARLDGSERKLVMLLDGMALYFPVWSPDGKWLIVSIPNMAATDGRPFQALIEVEACRVIPLPDYGGQVYSWGR